MFTIGGTVDRRTGLDIETGLGFQTGASVANQAYAEFLWTNVGGVGNKSWMVIQQYQTLFFYDVSGSTDIGTNFVQSLSFLSFQGASLTSDPGLTQCQFAQGNGYLYVTNPACDPFYLAYSLITNNVTATAITIQTRDLVGMPDTLGDSARPTSSVAALNASNPAHYYNLFNQGWGLTTALSLWDTARADLPSNQDYTALYRSSPTVPFDNTYVPTKAPGNVRSARGHYILNEFNPDRSAALVAEGFTAISGPSATLLYDPALGSNLVDGLHSWSTVSQAFDGITSGASNGANYAYNVANAQTLWIGKDYGATPRAVSNSFFYIQAGSAGVNWSWTFKLFGSNVAPSGVGGTGTLLATVIQAVPGNAQIILNSSDATTTFRYIWVQGVSAIPYATAFNGATGSTITGTLGIFVTECEFAYHPATSATPVPSRPSCVAWYAGRVFYSGQQTSNVSSNVYFSQIIQSTSAGPAPVQAGFCYQVNDPTSEQLAVLVSSDGGVIQIQDMGVVKKLFPFKSALLVFASNGVWMIEGAGGQGFQANDYLVRKLTAIGCVAGNSVVNYKGVPVWWAEDGIYTVNYNPNYDSYDPQSISISVINEFFQAVPIANRSFVKGGYDTVAQTAYWLFNDGTNPSLPAWTYNRVLLLNGLTQAFYPWTFSVPSNTNGPFVNGIMFVADGARALNPVMKFITTQTVAGVSRLYCSDLTSGLLYDWTVASGVQNNYLSFFLTNYKLDGQTQKFFQPGFVFVFLNTPTNAPASCYVQAYYDYATSEVVNKFSTAQQVFRSSYLNRKVNYRRLKVRGKGRVLQLYFSSDDGLPFSIYGWSFDESVAQSD